MSKDSTNESKASKVFNPTTLIIAAMLVVTLVAIILIIGISNKSKSASVSEDTEVAANVDIQEEQTRVTEDEVQSKTESESPNVDTDGEANGESNAAEKSNFNTGYPEYDQLLDKIAAAIESGESLETAEYSYVYGRFGNFPNSKFGYGFLDVDNDKQYELVIGESGSEEYPSILYDMYMLDGTNLVHVFCGGERDRYYATDIQNAFIEEGSSSADDFFYDTFVVEDGKRQQVDFVVEPKKINVELTPFKNS